MIGKSWLQNTFAENTYVVDHKMNQQSCEKENTIVGYINKYIEVTEHGVCFW